MTYFTGNVSYEKQGLLSPRKSTETVPQVAALNSLRFIAVVHFIIGKYFKASEHESDTFIDSRMRLLKTWGFTQANFLVVLSGFVLAYNYAPTVTEGGVGPGYSVRNFLLKRACWLYPTFLISLFLRVWDEPTTYVGRGRLWLKFAANAGCASGFWPPSFRTYHINDVAWMASIFMVMYVIVMPLFLKPMHKNLSRQSRQWLLVFMWPWTMFIGFVVERIDILTNDGTTHWDWNNPVFYIPSFLMGLTAGSIFVDRDLSKASPMYLFGGSMLFFGIMCVHMVFDVEPMYHWHQVGSLSLVEALMIYLFAANKDVVLGTVFGLKPVRIISSMATTAFIMQAAVSTFVNQIDWDRDWTFLISMSAFAAIMHFFVELPYAKWSLSFFDEKFYAKQ